VLAQALLAGASGQLRNMATTGGNLLQRTRCPYFQDVTTACNKREPGSGCSARLGVAHNHAVLGVSEHCVATHPSDMAVAMVALDAQVDVLGVDGARTLPVRELHRLPGAAPERDTVLEHGELITAVTLPPLPGDVRSAYRKVRERASYAFALVSVAAVVQVRSGALSDVRLALGGVAHKPWHAVRAEELLRGQVPTEERLRAAIDAELAAAEPLDSTAWKVELVRRTFVGALRDLTPELR
jgi:xanthine dehydrogenase YagS FAD-binding subunit